MTHIVQKMEQRCSTLYLREAVSPAVLLARACSSLPSPSCPKAPLWLRERTRKSAQHELEAETHEGTLLSGSWWWFLICNPSSCKICFTSLNSGKPTGPVSFCSKLQSVTYFTIFYNFAPVPLCSELWAVSLLLQHLGQRRSTPPYGLLGFRNRIHPFCLFLWSAKP